MASMALSVSNRPISPWLEMGAYEFLWTKAGQTFKTIAEMFRDKDDARPSDFVLQAVAEECAKETREILTRASVERFGLRLHGTSDYPERLRDAKYPVELLYFQGIWDLVSTPCVAVVGTRNPTEGGKVRAAKLARRLVADGYTVVSGLAAGIDAVAHKSAIESGGLTIAVIGTPLSQAYPNENAELQKFIAKEHLVISQIPVIRHSRQDWRHNRTFFPQRNVTMSALTKATVIVEASNTSGTLMQAHAAIHQKRKLYILDNCFRNPELTWPSQFEAEGAIRVKDYEEIQKDLAKTD